MGFFFLSALLIFAWIPSFARVCVQPPVQTCQNSQDSNLTSISNLASKLDPHSVAVAIGQPEGDFIKVDHEQTRLSADDHKEAVINLNPDVEFQKIWGFGAAITDSCVANFDRLSDTQKKEMMEKIFDPKKGAGFNILRLPIGSNDFSLSNYSLDDSPGNKPDPGLKHFDIKKIQGLVDFANEAKKYNPQLEIMMTPWSPPAWMKNTKSLKGGELEKKYYGAYADYLVKTIKALKAQGVPVKQMSILNEPLIWDAHETWSYSQSFMNEKDQQEFVNKYLVPRLEKMQAPPHILLHDHNWKNAKPYLDMIKNEKQSPLVSGVAYHCYDGNQSAMASSLTEQGKSLAAMNTECSSTQSNDNNKGTFQWWMKTQSVDAIRAGMSGAIGWNLCLDEKGGPHVDAGCDNCRGMATITSGQDPKIQMNAEFKALAQTSKYVQPGAVRIESSDPQIPGLSNVAFKNPDGSHVLVIRNGSNKAVSIDTEVQGCSRGITRVPAGGAITLKWKN